MCILTILLENLLVERRSLGVLLVDGIKRSACAQQCDEVGLGLRRALSLPVFDSSVESGRGLGMTVLQLEQLDQNPREP